MHPALGVIIIAVGGFAALAHNWRQGQNHGIDAAVQTELQRAYGLEFARTARAAARWTQAPTRRGVAFGDVPVGELELTQVVGERFERALPFDVHYGPVDLPDGRRGWVTATICHEKCVETLRARGVGPASLVAMARAHAGDDAGIGFTSPAGVESATAGARVPLPARTIAAAAGRAWPVIAALDIDPSTDSEAYQGDVGGQTEVCARIDVSSQCGRLDPGARCWMMIAGRSVASDGAAACPSPDPSCPAAFPLGDGAIWTRRALWNDTSASRWAREWTFGAWRKVEEHCWRDDAEQASSGCGAGMNGSRTWERVVRRWSDGRWGLRQDWRVVAESCSPCGVDEICDGGSDGPESSRCPDGSAIPAGGVCGEQPRCPDGSPRPASGVCPAMRRCPDGRLPPPSGICEESLPKTCPAGFRDVPESARYTSPWTSRPALATYSHCPSVQRREDIYGAENAWASAMAIRVVVPLTDLERYNPNLLVPGPQPALMRINPYEAAVACTRWGVERGYGDARCVSGAAIGQVTGGGFACFFDRFNEIQFHQDVNTAVFGDLSHWMQGSVGCVK